MPESNTPSPLVTKITDIKSDLTAFLIQHVFTPVSFDYFQRKPGVSKNLDTNESLQVLKTASDADAPLKERLESLEFFRQFCVSCEQRYTLRTAALVVAAMFAVMLATKGIGLFADWLPFVLGAPFKLLAIFIFLGGFMSVAGIILASKRAIPLQHKEYLKAYKSIVLSAMLNEQDGLHFDADPDIDINIFEHSRLIPKHRDFTVEDMFTGQFGQTKYQAFELQCVRRYREGRPIHIFKGIVLLLEAPRMKVQGTTVLIQDEKLQHNISNFFGDYKAQYLQEVRSNLGGLKKARMGSSEFEKDLDVMSDDQVEARYILDPVKIEALIAFAKKYDSQSIAASWFDNKMLLMLSTDHSYFDPQINDQAYKAQNMKKLIHEFYELQDMIKILSGENSEIMRVDEDKFLKQTRAIISDHDYAF